MRIYLSTHSTTFVTEKVIEMEIGIYITATIIIISRTRAMFGSLCRLLSTASEVNCRHTLRWTSFFCVLWLLAGDVRRMTCSFIALALEVHVF